MTIQDMDYGELVRTFVTESEESLARMEDVLLQLEHDPQARELLNDLFRAVHTVKGSGACVGFQGLTSFAHSIEEVLETLRSHDLQVSSQIVTMLLQVVDALRDSIASAVAGRDRLTDEQRALVEQIQLVLSGEQSPVESVAHDNITVEAKRTRSLRVSPEKLDRMLDLTGEIAVARGRVRQLIDDDAGRERILDSMRDLDRLSTDLQEAVMSVRLVPIGPALRFVHRIVRDLAAAKGKLVNVTMEGEDVELDLTLVEHIRDPLTHMVRNAIDHGIEDPQARTASGKKAAGEIRISIMRDSAGIGVRVADDGRGLDEARIVSRARALGIDTDRLTRQEIHSLIFEPGFSTAEEVTDISGRGVGMDIVRRNVELLRGTVNVETTPGKGTTVAIRLPLTLAVIEGFAVGAGGETFIIPIETVLECLDATRDLDRDSTFGVMELRGAPLPCVRLRQMFGTDGAGVRRESVVVVQSETGRAGLVVDSLYGHQQTVTKPLSLYLRRIPGIAGSSILGSGRVALILDIAELMRLVTALAESTTTAAATATR
jgi:two-component system, chemotaxis family, sensor kinase CheA